jgi:glutathione peroxidase
MPALYDIPVSRIDGSSASLKDKKGEVLLVVNVASKCGLTPQYEALEKLHEKYAGKGFAVLGFPANNFAGQEPGSNEEIAEFCTTKFNVQFPMYAKISVRGDDMHPLYAELVSEQPKARRRTIPASCARSSTRTASAPRPTPKSCGISRNSWSARMARRLPGLRRISLRTTPASPPRSRPNWPNRPLRSPPTALGFP